MLRRHAGRHGHHQARLRVHQQEGGAATGRPAVMHEAAAGAVYKGHLRTGQRAFLVPRQANRQAAYPMTPALIISTRRQATLPALSPGVMGFKA